MLDERRLREFREVARSLKDPVILITQVDPDAIGAALGMERILECVASRLKVTIAYCGAVAHPQNRMIFNKWNLTKRMVEIKQSEGLIDGLKGRDVILVDSSAFRDSRVPVRLLPLDPRIVIDHHRGTSPTECVGQFFWIEDVGSASTLVVELSNGLSVNFAAGDLNLALALGIYTDTQGLISAGPRDRDAYETVAATINPDALKGMIKYPLPASYFDQLGHVLGTLMTSGDRMVASAGEIPADDGDNLAAFADLLVRQSGITLVVVFGIIGNTVRLSVRCTNSSIDLNSVLKEWFGSGNAGAKLTPDGVGVGGGSIALDLGFWFSGGSNLREQLVYRKVTGQVFMGKVCTLPS